MHYSRPKILRDTLVDIVAIDQGGNIWLQQAKNTIPEWMLLRRQISKTDILGVSHEELTRLGFIVHEVTILRDGELHWAQEAKPLRMRHVLVLAEVNVGEAPASKLHYLQAFEYGEALKLRQQYSNDLKQLFDPTIDVVVRRQHLNRP